MDKISDIPILLGDTNSVIEFNNSIDTQSDNSKKRSFWDLLKNK